MSKNIQQEIENSIKVDYRSGSFLPKDYKTEDESISFRAMRDQNEIDNLRAEEDRRINCKFIEEYKIK